MNPSDTFESFDMNNFDDFLARESLEEEINTSGSNCSSSFSDSFDMMPVYRSLDVMMPADLMHMESQRQTGLDMVFEAPVLSRSREHEAGSVSVSVPAVQPQPVDDLFAQLEADLAHTSLPSCHQDSDTQQLGGIAFSTSLETNQSLSALSTTILNFLKSRGVHFEHCELSSQWKCEMTDFVDSCKFRIQVYSSAPSFEEKQEAFTVEFLRTSGSSLLFSKEFQHFKSSEQSTRVVDGVTGSTCTQAKAKEVVLSDVSHLSPVVEKSMNEGAGAGAGTGTQSASQQAALESFVKWASSDPAEATRAVCGLFNTGGKEDTAAAVLSPLLQITSSSCATGSDQLSSEGILVMTLLGALCMQFKHQETGTERTEIEQSTATPGPSSSALPLLSLLHLLLQTRRVHSLEAGSSSSALQAVLSALIESLTPASSRLANSNSDQSQSGGAEVSVCEKQSAKHLLARIVSFP